MMRTKIKLIASLHCTRNELKTKTEMDIALGVAVEILFYMDSCLRRNDK